MIFATVYPWVENLLDTYYALPEMARDITSFVSVVTVVLLVLRVWCWAWK